MTIYCTLENLLRRYILYCVPPVDNSVVIAGGMGGIRGLNGNGKNTIKIKKCSSHNKKIKFQISKFFKTRKRKLDTKS